MSASSQVIPKLGGKSCPSIYKYMMGIVGLTSGSLAMNLWAEEANVKRRLEHAKDKLEKAEVKTIFGEDAKYYPWQQDPTKDWEFDLVKMRGFFKEERFFVSRKKDGKDGFAVFAPFVTSLVNTNHHPYEVDIEKCSGIMINMGWVPASEKGSIDQDDAPLGKLDMEELCHTHDFYDRHTGFKYKAEYDGDKEIEHPYTDVVGMLRRDERANPWIGNTNMPHEHIWQYVDTHHMKCWWNFMNVIDYDDYHLERVVDDQEDDESFPIPATRTTFVRGNGTAELWGRWGNMFGGVSAVSLMTLAAMLVK